MPPNTVGGISSLFFIIGIAREERQVLCTAADRRVRGTPAWNSGIIISSIHAARWQPFAMHRFDQDTCYFLRKRAMLCGGTSAKRFLQLIWNIRPDKDAFAVCHICEWISYW